MVAIWTVLLAWITAAALAGTAIGTAIHQHQGWECRRCGALNKSEDSACRECATRIAHHTSGAAAR